MPIYAPTTLEKGLRTLFLHTLAGMQAKTLIGLIASIETTAADSEKFIHLGQPPQMQPFKGDIEYGDLTEAGYTITPEQYAGGLVVRRKDLINDQTGGIRMRVMQLAAVASRHADKLGIQALVNGTSSTIGLCYDGVSYYNDAHPARKGEGGTQDNLLAGSGTSSANVVTDITQALTYFGNAVAENGEPYFDDAEPREITFAFPWALIGAFKTATGAKELSGTTNVVIDGIRVRLVPSGRLYKESADANDWYALRTDMPVKPLIQLIREGVSFHAQESDASDSVFDHDLYKYKTMVYHTVKYGPWQMACKFVNT